MKHVERVAAAALALAALFALPALPSFASDAGPAIFYVSFTQYPAQTGAASLRFP